MRVGRTVPDYEQDYFMNGIKLERSEAEQDLGVFIEQDLSFDKHISVKVNKANFIAGLIPRSFEYIDCDSFKLLFTALVRPHLEYAQATWSPFLKKTHPGHRECTKTGIQASSFLEGAQL